MTLAIFKSLFWRNHPLNIGNAFKDEPRSDIYWDVIRKQTALMQRNQAPPDSQSKPAVDSENLQTFYTERETNDTKS